MLSPLVALLGEVADSVPYRGPIAGGGRAVERLAFFDLEANKNR